MNLLGFLKNILQLVLSPVHGWRDIGDEDSDVDVTVSRGMFPLMAVMLLTVFVRPLYDATGFDLVSSLQTALIQFVALYVGFYAGRTVIDNYLPRYNTTGARDPIAADMVAAYITGLMTLIQIFENLLPVELAVLQVLPLFAAIILWKAGEYLDLKPEDETHFMFIAIAALILPVVFINLVMSYLIG